MTKRFGAMAAMTIATAWMVAGCAQLEKTESKIDTAAQTAEAMRALAERNATKGSGVRTSRPRLAGEEVVLKTSALPAIFEQQDSYSTKGAQSLMQVLEDISVTRGIPIKTGEIGQFARQGQNVAPQPAVPGALPITGSVVLEYSGTLRGLLDEIAAKADVTWRYNPQTKAVEFYRYETRTLSIYLPAGSKSIAASISLAGVSGGGGSSAGGGGSTGAGNVSVSQNLTVDPWASIMEGIGTILGSGENSASAGAAGSAGSNGGGRAMSASGSNGNAIANPELGLITVTARPPAMERISRYVSSINARYAQNVMIDVKVFSVSLDQQSSLGFNLSMLYNSLDRYGASIVGPAPLQAGPGTPGVLTLRSADPTSRWNGSSLVAQALSQFGKVSLQKQGQVLAVNGQPSPMQVANEITYVASSSTTTSPNVGAVTTQTPGVKVVGFTANFLPLILGDNRILLSYQMQISALAAPLTPNAQGVVTPNISSQSLQQQAFVRDGQAIVLFGYDEQRDGLDSSFNIAGWSRAGRNERQMIVIVMQVNAGVKDEGI